MMVPTADPTPHRFASLDGIRAVAATVVVVFHAAVTTQVTAGGTLAGDAARGLGNLGVGVFFALSGFLLYRPYATAHFGDTAPRPLRRYVRHRVLRIFPAYWLAAGASILVFGLAVPATLGNVLGVVTLTDMYFSKPYLSTTPVPVAWTLTAEVAFYLLIPVVALVISRGLGARARSPHGKLAVQLVGIGALVTIAYLYRSVVLLTDIAFPVNAYSYFITYLDWFGGGMLLAVAVAWRDTGGTLPNWMEGLGKRWWLSWGLAGWAYVVAVALRDRSLPDGIAMGGIVANERLITLALTAITSALVVLPAVIGERDRGPMARTLQLRTMTWLGMVSYGIYLWHLLVMRWLNTNLEMRDFLPLLATTIVITIPIAAASWYLVEAPLLRRKDPRGRPDSPERGAAAAGQSVEI
jgi:peptidoglycan/LPS O-acetylase OafA/YrhL